MIKKFIRKVFGSDKETTEKKQVPAPTVVKADEHQIDLKQVSRNALRVTSTLQEAGFEAFVVGGAVRDLLLGEKPKDFDVATNATPQEVRRLFRRAFIIGRRFQIVHVMFGQDVIEVTTFRGATPVEETKTDSHGRVLRDNTFGEQHEDASRRDFSINAMYYDPSQEVVLDYHGGMEDIRKKLLRIIGTPEVRYREDPVRMLRIIRFAAKLQFDIDADAQTPIPLMAPLINNVPDARVYDEMMKLLMGGHALACLHRLRDAGLHHGLLPLLDLVMEQPQGEKFVSLALNQTDWRIQQGKSSSPAFLFAAILWQQVAEKWAAYKASGDHPAPALNLAINDVLDLQTRKLSLQRKIVSDMREIWVLQLRFERRSGKTPYKMLEHRRYRGAYDFLLLRCEAGEVAQELADWWTAFMLGDDAEKEALIAQGRALTQPKSNKKRPSRRGRRGRSRQPAGEKSVEQGEPS